MPPRTRSTHRRIHPRTRTGCLTCRRRKKKCDEGKPRCIACTRNKLDCAWPPPPVYRRRSIDLDAPELDTSSPSPSPSPSPSGERKSSESAKAAATDDTLVIWSHEFGTFLSSRRAGMLLPASGILLSHYLVETAPLLATAPARNNPFLSCVMSIAYNDDLLMHSILALSGSHLSFKLEESNNIEIQQATYQHYALVLQSLHQAMDDPVVRDDPVAMMHLLLCMMILCHYEAISGDLSGSIFTHLRASRQLILQMLDQQQQIRTDEKKTLCGTILEIYSYIVLANAITPYGMIQSRTLIYDPFLLSLGDLSDFDTFGIMFGGSHELFEMILHVSLFSAQQQMIDDDAEPSIERLRAYRDLKICIMQWNPPVVESSAAEWLLQRKAVFEVFRNALLIYLETGLSLFAVDDKIRIAKVQIFIDLAMTYLKQISCSTYECILMWPLMIIGSCLVNKEQQDAISLALNHNRYQMKNTCQGSWLLQLLWEDGDSRAIGPYGLGLVMEKRGFSYGVV